MTCFAEPPQHTPEKQRCDGSPPTQSSVQSAGSSLVVMALGLKSTTVVLSPFLVLALFSTFHKNDLKPGTRKTRPHAELNDRNYVEKDIHSWRFMACFASRNFQGCPSGRRNGESPATQSTEKSSATNIHPGHL